MVMEFLEGHDLGAAARSSAACSPVQWAVELMLQTAEALAEAHSLGIVHRDVKPTNLFVTWRPDGSALDQGPRLRHLEVADGHGHAADADAVAARHARVHVARSRCASARLVDIAHATSGRSAPCSTSSSRAAGRSRPRASREMCVKVAVDPPAPMVNTPPALQPVDPALPREVARAALREHGRVRARPRAVRAGPARGARCSSSACSACSAASTFNWEGTGTGVSRVQAVARSRQRAGPCTRRRLAQWGAG